jgi:3'-5' exoribonuclease
MAKRTYIRDLQPSQWVEGVFAIYNCQLGRTKTEKPYIKCLLADKSGRTPGRMWNATEELFSILPTDGFVRIEGQTQPYQGEMQIIIQQMNVATPTAAEIMELLPCSPYEIEPMFAEVRQIMATLKHTGIRSLAATYLDDAELMSRFKQAPAAMALHHAYLGGLLEHTLQLLRLADKVLPLYPKVNRDIVLMGLFLHDLGKCDELVWETGFGYSDDGQLIGHVARGAIWLQRRAEDCALLGEGISEPILRVLLHIILSHHGQPEFGALKIPATPEAIMVSMLDNLDAKMHMALSAARGESVKSDKVGGNFTEKIWALDTRIYRPDPTTVEE